MFNKDHTPKENHKIDIWSFRRGNAIKNLRLKTKERFYLVDVINLMEG